MTTDRDLVTDTVTRLFWFTDHHRWPELRSVLDDVVRLDYTSLQGGDPVELSPDDVVAGWRATLETLDAHQHLVGNRLIALDGGTAEVTAAFQATHQFAGDTWTLGGDYAFRLRRRDNVWVVSAMIMTAGWQTGDPGLVARAAQQSSRR